MKLRQVARMMRISEYDLFRRAYIDYNEGRLNDIVVARVFMHYARNGVVPEWVSTYARNVVEKCKVYAPLRSVA